jgi:hypothetical protein
VVLGVAHPTMLQTNTVGMLTRGRAAGKTSRSRLGEGRPLSSASSVPTPPGRYLILDAVVGSARDNGWIDHGRLVPLTPATGPWNFEPFAAAADEAV